MKKAVLFDLDGVICDTAHYHFLAWRKLAQHLGGDITEEFNETLKGVDRSESLKRILAEINVELSAEDFEKYMTLKNDWYVEMLQDIDQSEVLDGILPFIKSLKDNDIKVAIASASKNAPVILEKIGLMQYVDTIANPSDVKENKPAPDIFLLAAKQAGVDKDLCIGIEDSQAGIDALNSAKIDSIAIGTILNDATITLASTSELSLELLK